MVEHASSIFENGNGIYNAANGAHNAGKELKDSLSQIKQYLEKNILDLSVQVEKKDKEINQLKESLQKAHLQAEGNSQLINKLLGDLSKLQNDIEWYKLTYEKRSLLGTVREKLFRKH